MVERQLPKLRGRREGARACHLHTTGFDLPERRMISAVPQPSAVARMMLARHTCFCGAGRDEAIERYLNACNKGTSRRGPEPFFIKNLENVQGDERDFIMIS